MSRTVGLVKGLENGDDSEKPGAVSLAVYYGENAGSRIGFLQICMIVITILADCHVAACLFYFVFESSNQGWLCGDISDYSPNASNIRPYSNNISPADNMTSSVYVNELNNSNVTVVYDGTCDCASHYFNPAYTSPATEFDLVCNRRSIGKLMTAAYFTGSIFGSLIGGHLGDRYGRKTLALCMWTLMSAAQTLTSLAPNWQVYAMLRFLVGVGGGPVSGSLMVLCSEYMNVRWRSLVSSQMGFSMGSLLATLLTYLLCGNWRHLVVTLGLIFSPLILLALWVLPESARLLLLQDRVHKAHKQLTKLAHHNNVPPPDMIQLKLIAKNERSTVAQRRHYSVLDMFRGGKMASLTSIVLLCWLSTSFVSFGLKSSISDITGNLYANSIIGFAGAVPCRIITIFATNTIGRRWCYVVVTSFVTVALLIVTVFKSTTIATAYPMAASGVAMVGNAVSDGNWIVVNLFSTELYSTEMRNTAVGVVYMMSRTGASVAPFILLLDTVHKSIPYVLFAVMELASIFLSLKLPETRDRPLINSQYSVANQQDADELALTNHSANNSNTQKSVGQPLLENPPEYV